MSTPPDIADGANLPPRTWRQWWRDQPRWVHIAAWAVRGIVLLHLLIALRIAWGWQESAGVTDLRGRLHTVRYFWEERRMRFPYEELLWAGWFGRDWRNISAIKWSVLGQDSHLIEIGRRCRGLKALDLKNANVSVRAIAGLGNCRALERLNLDNTNTDDDVIAQFQRLSRLETLSLAGTLVTDESLAVLNSLPHLRRADLTYTDVTREAIDSWRTSRKHYPVISSERIEFPHSLVSSLRWSDGERSVKFPRSFQVTIDGPADTLKQQQFIDSRAEFTRQSSWWHNQLKPLRDDGEYQLTIRFGEIASHPIHVTVRDRKPSTTNLEFQMPCTRAEALKRLQP